MAQSFNCRETWDSMPERRVPSWVDLHFVRHGNKAVWGGFSRYQGCRAPRMSREGSVFTKREFPEIGNFIFMRKNASEDENEVLVRVARPRSLPLSGLVMPLRTSTSTTGFGLLAPGG